MLLFGSELLLTKLVYEVRYDLGNLYLDRCGATINELTERDSSWMVNNVTPQNAPLIHAELGCILNFSSEKIIISLEQNPNARALSEAQIGSFQKLCTETTETIFNILELKKFTRVGFRIWHMISQTSDQKSERWMIDNGLIVVPEKVTSAFSGTHESASSLYVLELNDRKVRLSFAGARRDPVIPVNNQLLKVSKGTRGYEKVLQNMIAKENPVHIVLIDADFSVENPPKPDAQAFIDSSIKILIKSFAQLERLSDDKE